MSAGGQAGRYGKPGVHNAERATVAGSEVSEDAFPQAVRDLLASEPKSHERELRLQGVVARQMTRVASRYKARDRDRATASLAGAMYVVHAGELKTGRCSDRTASRRCAPNVERRVRRRRATKGRARATYEMLLAHRAGRGEGGNQVAPSTRSRHGRAIRAAVDVMQTAGCARSGRGDAPLRSSRASRRATMRPRSTVDSIEKAARGPRGSVRARGTQVTRQEGLEARCARSRPAPIVLAAILRSQRGCPGRA